MRNKLLLVEDDRNIINSLSKFLCDEGFGFSEKDLVHIFERFYKGKGDNSDCFDADFYLPWYSVTIAVLSVFVGVFTAMLYSMKKLSKENIVETLRNENI